MHAGMSNDNEQPHSSEIHPGDVSGEPVWPHLVDLRHNKVIGVVAVCDVDKAPTENVRPTMSMSIRQFLKLADQSMIHIDMDRGVTTTVLNGDATWKRTADDIIAEVVMLVQADAEHVGPDTFPWQLYAEAAQERGLDIQASDLVGVPYTVLISDRLARLSGF